MFSVQISGENFTMWLYFEEEDGFIEAIRSYVRKGYEIRIPARKKEEEEV